MDAFCGEPESLFHHLADNQYYDTHQGASKMKLLPRSYIWYPKMDSDIEDLAKSCSMYQQTRAHPTKAPLHPWEWPALPTLRLCRALLKSHVLSTS